MIDFEEYQKKAWETALETAKNPAYMVSNLASEAGEVAGKYAKWVRDGILDEEGLQKEMGDVLWQVAGLATVMGWSLSDLASKNLQKLADRKARLAINGSGDNR
jgi:NTP pyrophosphatase (non-canonical NTP hydrolase)